AVDVVRDPAAVADDFQTGPLLARAVGVLRAAEAELVLPVRIATEPVDPPAIEGLAFAPFFPDGFAVTILGDFAGERDIAGRAVFLRAAHEDEVADAPFDDLRFDGGHPDSAVVSVRADAVHQHTGVLRALLPVPPGAVAPAVFDDQVVILVFVLGEDGTQAVTGDVQQSVLDGEHLPGIFVL